MTPGERRRRYILKFGSAWRVSRLFNVTMMAVSPAAAAQAQHSAESGLWPAISLTREEVVHVTSHHQLEHPLSEDGIRALSQEWEINAEEQLCFRYAV